MDIAHSIELLRKKLFSYYREPGAHCRVGRVGLQLSKPAFSSPAFLVAVHIPPFSMSNGICSSCKTFSIASAVKVSYVQAFLVDFNFGI